MEGIAPNNSCTSRAAQVLEKKARPQEQLNCPRCNSTNTKFCYYNNYSLTQPRYFCKTCRRYWTEGGSLRNVPVGGGSRRNKKIISASPSSTSSSASPKVSVPDLNPPINNPKMLGGGHDLNLAFPVMENNTNKYHHHHHSMSQYIEMPKIETGNDAHSVSAIEMLRSGMAAPNRSLNNNDIPNYVHSLLPSSNALFPHGFPMQEIKPNLGFSIDALENRSSSSYGVHENGRLLFPFGEMKQQLSAAAGQVEVEQNKEQGNSTGYWTGMIGEGSSW